MAASISSAAEHQGHAAAAKAHLSGTPGGGGLPGAPPGVSPAQPAAEARRAHRHPRPQRCRQERPHQAAQPRALPRGQAGILAAHLRGGAGESLGSTRPHRPGFPGSAGRLQRRRAGQRCGALGLLRLGGAGPQPSGYRQPTPAGAATDGGAGPGRFGATPLRPALRWPAATPAAGPSPGARPPGAGAG